MSNGRTHPKELNSAPGIISKEIPFLREKTKYGVIKCQSRSRQRELIESFVPKYPNSVICEIGLFGGINIFALYDKFKKYNMEIVGIDPHEKIEIFNGVHFSEIDKELTHTRYNFYKGLRLNIEDIIQRHKLDVQYINDTSWNAHSLLKDNSIGILHVDGDHSYKGVKKDLNLFWSKMKKNSVILMDDFEWKGVKEATLEFQIQHKDTLKLEETFEGKKGILYVSK